MAPSQNQPIPPCHVVAMPYPGRGHINPMIDFCIAVAESSSDILITFIVTEEWLGLIGSMDKPSNMRFVAIPNVVPSERVRGDDIYGFVIAVLTKMEEPFERLLDEPRLPPPALIVTDAFLPWAAEVAGRRNIPVAYLWTMSASVYTVLYHFDLLVQNGHFPIDLSVNGDAIVDYIPGLSPVRVAELPAVLRDQERTPTLLKIMPQESKANYLIFTSIYELEAQVLDALKDKLAFSIYNFGPATSYFKVKDIIHSTANVRDDGTNNYLKWLDIQPPNSVLYVSLGSFLSVSRAQMDEIAIGLRQSGVRFLLVAKREALQLQELCGYKGLAVEWCDQLRVLCHPSIGGFWSHCGWNSTKEAVLTGVPMLTSPIHMDQLPNAKAIVEDWRTGWRLLKREFDEENLVKGNEIGEIVKRFMDLENKERGEIVRNARDLRDACEREFEKGKLFWNNVEDFIKSIM